MVKIRSKSGWETVSQHLNIYDSLFDQMGDMKHTPEIINLRETIKEWRFYDHFRTDKDAPARQIQLATRTPVLYHDGRDLTAALQTIIEIGNNQALNAAIEDAFPGSKITITKQGDGYLSVEMNQHGLLRPLACSEFSDGTLRYLLLVAALMTPRPPKLMILNEPETSLHPDLLPSLARLIIQASKNTQIWVISHANCLVDALNNHPQCNRMTLEKQVGQTKIIGQDFLRTPQWKWPDS
ncbi:AAA family ATPase [Legionella yabuuchiae]|uniref:AAA family ATPase n=1 Tax=Legionella yabuuchiae TaxID=376727 RepID=UPI001055B395|nr:AAA family ATPase [Legionella yabuuchiae]